MKVYAAMYNPMTYESAAYTVSVHKTKQGARDALAQHIRQERKKNDDMYRAAKGFEEEDKYYYFKDLWHLWWGIDEIEILD